MSTHSDLPELHVNQYSVERVGEEVIWPLVDDTWGDDWRNHAFVDEDDMRMPRRGVMPPDVEARRRVPTTDNVDAIILARCEADHDDGICEEIVFASLVVRLHVDSDPKDQMIQRAIRDAEELEELEGEEDQETEDDEENECEDKYPVLCRDVNDFDDPGDELLAIIETEFQFDSGSVVQVHRSQRLVAPDGATIWMPRMEVDENNPEACAPVHMPATFSEADMDLLECGLRVFRTPKAILRALEEIRQHPVK